MSVGEWIFGGQTLDAGTFRLCRAEPWPIDRLVHWHVRPVSGQTGILTIAGVAVEARSDGNLVYHLAVCNVGKTKVDFQVFYEEREVFAVNASTENVALPWSTRLASQRDPGTSATPPGGDAELAALGVTLQEYQLLNVANILSVVPPDTWNALVQEVGLQGALNFIFAD